jgi:hypothetical protein
MQLQKVTALLFIMLFCLTESVKAQQPMSCQLEGRIIEILYSKEASAHVVAKVLLVSCNNCGSSVSISHNSGDTIMVHFATNKKTPYRLHKNDVFMAQAYQHLKPGADGEWWVYVYTLKAKQTSIHKTHLY